MKKLISKVLALTLTLGMSISVANAVDNVNRVSGKDKYKTAIEVSKSNYTNSENVILASGDEFADALAGGQLSLNLDAPILLIGKGQISSEIKEEIKRLNAKNIYILGEKNSISKEIEDELDKDYKIKRLGGKDRYETSKIIMKETEKLGEFNQLVLVSGIDFADALSSSNYLAKNSALLMLSNGKELPKTDKEIIVIGGKEKIELPDFKGRRIAGKDRYETSMLLVNEFFKDAKNGVLVSGERYPDGLTSVSFLNKFASPIILTRKDALDDEAKSYIDKLEKLVIVGGEQTISEDILKEDETPLDIEGRVLDAKEVSEMIKKEDVKVFDLRKLEDYELGHIPGALNISNKEFEDPDNPVDGELATPEQFEELMSSYGIKNTDTIIVYSQASKPQMAPRLVWTLEAYGHTNTYILDGHYDEWTSGEFEIEEGPQKEQVKSEYKIISQENTINVDKNYVIDIIDGKTDAILLDCRPEEQYASKEPTSDGNAKGGHIPGAVNVPYMSTVGEDGKFLSVEELKKLYSEVGINEDSEVVVYCQRGHRASHSWFVLKYVLGYENIKVYDGSMMEWSNLEDQKVEF